jgi:hypothetical protein
MKRKTASTIMKMATGRTTERRSRADIGVSLLVMRHWSTSTMPVVHTIVPRGAVKPDTARVSTW